MKIILVIAGYVENITVILKKNSLNDNRKIYVRYIFNTYIEFHFKIFTQRFNIEDSLKNNLHFFI